MAYYGVTTSSDELDPDDYIETSDSKEWAVSKANYHAKQDAGHTYYVHELTCKPVFKVTVEMVTTSEVIV
jgi:hypothetical protein